MKVYKIDESFKTFGKDLRDYVDHILNLFPPNI